MPLSPVQIAVVLGISVETVLAQASFSNTITLGSIILGIIVLVVAALFTIRSNVASVWRQEAEGWKERAESERHDREEREKELQAQLDQEREVRHGLKNELAGIRAELAIEKAKPDLSLIVEQGKQNYAAAMTQITSMVEGIVATQNNMLEVLARLATALDATNGKDR